MRKIYLSKRDDIWKVITRLRVRRKRSLGRNSGKIVLRRRFNKFRYLYKSVDFIKAIWNVYAYILNVEYDAGRNAFLCMIIYTLGVFSYITHCSGLRPGDRVYTRPGLESAESGHTTTLWRLIGGQVVHNIEAYPGSGAVFSRSAGCFSTILHNEGNNSKFVWLRVSSRKVIKLSKYCLATIGTISNFKFKYKRYNNAGSIFKIGRRPSVRGLAMNPVDHPHGGGEGKKSKPRQSKTVW